MKRTIFILTALSLLYGFTPIANARAVIQLNQHFNIYTSAKVGEPVYKAVLALQRDVKKITGTPPNIKPLSEIRGSGIVLINSQKDTLVEHMTGEEAHHVYVKNINGNKQIVLQGADMRGTIYAIYTFSENVLGVPPLWFFSEWKPGKPKSIKVSDDLNIRFSSPQVKYRAWFPNDEDLLIPWKKLNQKNNEIWLETALRLKINTVQGNGNDFSKKHDVSETVKLINDFGLINTTHHHAPLDASFSEWADYWKNIRNTQPPAPLLANEDEIEEFWKYTIETVKKQNIDMLWVINFRGGGDKAFWHTFKDAPESMKERGEVINRMMKKQRDLVINITGNPNSRFTTIFYDELSDLLAKGYINPPADSNQIYTFVAARRDHFPNNDIQQLPFKGDINLGYYLNLQFTSTGSHLAEGEGPWKMERNFRYVQSKSANPLKFSVVNAGNVREFLLGLSANAKMMWNFEAYDTDRFLKEYSSIYFGQKYSKQIVKLYKDYFDAYWNQKEHDLEGFDRQYLFQDLRYKVAISQISSAMNREYNPNPLKDYPSEQEPGRTFRIVPEDNGADNQVDAIINGTIQSSMKFLKTAKTADKIYGRLQDNSKPFFNNNLRVPAYFMYYLNQSLLNLCKAYQIQEDNKEPQKRLFLKKATDAMKDAKDILQETAYGDFSEWYAKEWIFGFDKVYNTLNKLLEANPN